MKSVSPKKFLAFLLFLSFAFAFSQYQIPKKPQVLYPVYDEAGLLSESQRNQLNDKLMKYEDSTSTEIEVVIIPSTKGEDVNFLATQFGEKWGIGKKEQDNGVVFLIASEDRTMSIQQGRDVEKYLTASVAGQILDYLVTPRFKNGQFYEGIDYGTSAIMDALQGKYTKIQQPKSGGGVSIFRIIFIAFIVLMILSFLSRNNRGGGRDDDDDVIITRRGRRVYPGGFFPFPMGGGFGGGGSFGGGGGGFGGFGGGGSFGGGGASGGW